MLADCNHANIVRYGGSYFKDEKLWVRCLPSPPQLPLVWVFWWVNGGGGIGMGQICMEYCGGGSVSDLCLIMDSGLEEEHIAIICREALQVQSPPSSPIAED